MYVNMQVDKFVDIQDGEVCMYKCHIFRSRFFQNELTNYEDFTFDNPSTRWKYVL